MDHTSRNVHPIERVASGAAGIALAVLATKKSGATRAVAAAVGGDLLLRAATGHCYIYGALRTGTAGPQDSKDASVPHKQGIRVEHSVIIQRDIHDVYSFWRDLNNLPDFMDHLISVETTSPTRSHWVAKAPFNKQVEWDADIINDEHDSLIAWKSVQGSGIANAGSVRFIELPNDRGTEVHVILEYTPPAGRLGFAVAKASGEEPQLQVERDLRKFKQIMETGEVPTIQGQPSGPRTTKGKLLQSVEG